MTVSQLFPDPPAGHTAPQALQAAGITYRQLDYWDRSGLVSPSIRAAHGSGTKRLYSDQDVTLLRIVKRLMARGFSMAAVREIVEGE